jgi:hypothetical protein
MSCCGNIFEECLESICGLVDEDERPKEPRGLTLGQDGSKNHPHQWTDFSGTLTIHPEYVRVPRTRDELLAVRTVLVMPVCMTL